MTKSKSGNADAPAGVLWARTRALSNPWGLAGLGANFGSSNGLGPRRALRAVPLVDLDKMDMLSLCWSLVSNSDGGRGELVGSFIPMGDDAKLTCAFEFALGLDGEILDLVENAPKKSSSSSLTMIGVGAGFVFGGDGGAWTGTCCCCC